MKINSKFNCKKATYFRILKNIYIMYLSTILSEKKNSNSITLDLIQIKIQNPNANRFVLTEEMQIQQQIFFSFSQVTQNN